MAQRNDVEQQLYLGGHKWKMVAFELFLAAFTASIAWALYTEGWPLPPAFVPIVIYGIFASGLCLVLAVCRIATLRLPGLRSIRIDGRPATGVREWFVDFIVSQALSAALVTWGVYEIWLGLTSDPAEYALVVALIAAITFFLLVRLALTPLRRRLPLAIWLTDEHVIGDGEMGRGRIPRSDVRGIRAGSEIICVFGPVSRKQPPKGFRLGGKAHTDQLVINTEAMGVTPAQIETWLRRELDLWEDEWPLEESDMRWKEVEDGFNDALRVIYRGKKVPQEMKLNLWPNSRRSSFRSKR